MRKLQRVLSDLSLIHDKFVNMNNLQLLHLRQLHGRLSIIAYHDCNSQHQDGGDMCGGGVRRHYGSYEQPKFMWSRQIQPNYQPDRTQSQDKHHNTVWTLHPFLRRKESAACSRVIQRPSDQICTHLVLLNDCDKGLRVCPAIVVWLSLHIVWHTHTLGTMFHAQPQIHLLISSLQPQIACMYT